MKVTADQRVQVRNILCRAIPDLVRTTASTLVNRFSDEQIQAVLNCKSVSQQNQAVVACTQGKKVTGAPADGGNPVVEETGPTPPEAPATPASEPDVDVTEGDPAERMI